MKNTFRWIGILEGLSFLALLGVAMPLKYGFGVPEATRIPGMIHGLLFIAYVLLASGLAKDENWPKLQFRFALLASVLPFGTFAFDRKYLSGEGAR